MRLTARKDLVKRALGHFYGRAIIYAAVQKIFGQHK